MQNLEIHLQQIAQNGAGFDIESEIIEYGQYLRYEVENFIKCRILHWNEGEFAKVIDGSKENKKLSNIDLDKLKDIYHFCNWTTSHVDVGDDHGLNQLKAQIADFIGIQGKYPKTGLQTTP